MSAALDTKPRAIDTRDVEQARSLMNGGWDLHEAAASIGVQSRDLDYALWRSLGGEVYTPPAKPETQSERNARICNLYEAGVEVEGLMERFDMTRAGIWSILARGGFKFTGRP